MTGTPMPSDGRLGPMGDEIVFENDRVRIWELTLPPGADSNVHQHELDYILVILEGDKIAAIPEPDSGGDHHEYFEADVVTPMVVELKKGGIETAKNIGEQRYYELLIEIL